MIDTFSFSQNFYHELWGFSDSHDWAASLLSVWYWFSFVWLKCILFIKFLPIRQSIFNSDSMIYALGIGVLFKDSLKIDTQTHTVTSWAHISCRSYQWCTPSKIPFLVRTEAHELFFWLMHQPPAASLLVIRAESGLHGWALSVPVILRGISN